MGEKTAKWVFWAGTLSSLVLFLALTVDTNGQFAALTNADKLDGQVVAGKRAFERHNCNDCHTILGFGGYYAPDLTRAYTRVGEDAIRRRLEHPEIALATSYRKMPQQHLTQQEVGDIIHFLQWVAEIDNHDWPPQDSTARWKRSTERLLASASMSPAAALVQQENCLSCHALGDRGESKGPRLEWIGSRRGADYIAQYLADPEKMAPGAEMPAFDHLSPGQREMIGEFIVALAGHQGR
jgi:nitric oxide reductase subunit C